MRVRFSACSTRPRPSRTGRRACTSLRAGSADHSLKTRADDGVVTCARQRAGIIRPFAPSRQSSRMRRAMTFRPHMFSSCLWTRAVILHNFRYLVSRVRLTWLQKQRRRRAELRLRPTQRREVSPGWKTGEDGAQYRECDTASELSARCGFRTRKLASAGGVPLHLANFRHSNRAGKTARRRCLPRGSRARQGARVTLSRRRPARNSPSGERSEGCWR